jgi:hypothetical protein
MMSDWWDQLDRLQKRLEALARRLPARDASLLKLVVEQLEHLEDLQGDLEDLADEFANIDRALSKITEGSPDEANVAELFSATRALEAVSDFLLIRAQSEAIRRLQVALWQLILGGPLPAMFEPEGVSGRRPDTETMQWVKGALAGFMHFQQTTGGLSRKEAAKWIADNISPKLARRISSRPISGRTVEEWLDRYGGKHPPDDPGGKAFKVWSSRSATWPLTKTKFREITERIATTLPSPKS